MRVWIGTEDQWERYVSPVGERFDVVYYYNKGFRGWYKTHDMSFAMHGVPEDVDGGLIVREEKPQ